MEVAGIDCIEFLSEAFWVFQAVTYGKRAIPNTNGVELIDMDRSKNGLNAASSELKTL